MLCIIEVLHEEKYCNDTLNVSYYTERQRNHLQVVFHQSILSIIYIKNRER